VALNLAKQERECKRANVAIADQGISQRVVGNNQTGLVNNFTGNITQTQTASNTANPQQENECEQELEQRAVAVALELFGDEEENGAAAAP
jgi:hypothetical protein